MVMYKLLKSKAELLLAFFLTCILINLLAKKKWILDKSYVSTTGIKATFTSEHFYGIINLFLSFWSFIVVKGTLTQI